MILLAVQACANVAGAGCHTREVLVPRAHGCAGAAARSDREPQVQFITNSTHSAKGRYGLLGYLPKSAIKRSAGPPISAALAIPSNAPIIGLYAAGRHQATDRARLSGRAGRSRGRRASFRSSDCCERVRRQEYV